MIARINRYTSTGETSSSARKLDGAHSRLPVLDGIRGLAVLLVLICHATMLNEAPGTAGKLYLALARLSWAGVDLFFVLSGFLITGILFDAKGRNNFFRNFYARRTVRIFPLYYAFVAFAFLIAPRFAGLDAHFGDRPMSSWPYWLYISNFSQTLHPTHHIVFVSWSLAIEEQFYLVWPLVVFLFSRKALLRITVGMIVGSILLRVGIMLPGAAWVQSMGLDPWRIANNFTIFRLDGLAAGAWIALMIRGSNCTIQSLAKPARVIGVIAAIALAASVGIAYTSGWRGGIGQSPPYVLVGYTSLAVMFGSLLSVTLAAKSDSILARFFRSRTLMVFGKYSYAVYLLHFPLNVLMRDLLFDPAAGSTPSRQLLMQAAFYALSIMAALAMAWISWHVLEKHFLKLKDWFPSPASRGGPANVELPATELPEEKRFIRDTGETSPVTNNK